MSRFRDRIEAGMLLAEKLKPFCVQKGLVLAVPRGGVPVAFIVARELGLPLDLVLTRKIGHPFNEEYAIGAVSLTDYFVVPHPDVPESYIQSEITKIRLRLKEMQFVFLGDDKQQTIKDKTVVVIDDGVATGNTLLGTIHLLRKSGPARIIVAVPVASTAAMDTLSAAADEVVALYIPDVFSGVGAFYDDFHQVSDEEVLYYLGKFRNEIKRIA